MLTVLPAVAALWIVAVVTPGPNFLAVLRVSAAHPRRGALRAVAGIGLGTLLWGIAGFFGIHLLFTWQPVLFFALRLLGGLYLLALGLRLLWSAARRSAPAAAPTPVGGPAFRIGLATSLSNPKSALFVTSLFAATMPAHAPPPLGLAAVALMVAISVGWYSAIACLFTTRRMQDAQAALRRWIDLAAGAAFTAFGLKFVLER